jgi:hypothetical protein
LLQAVRQREVQQLLIGMLRFSQCTALPRSAELARPTTNSEGRPVFLLSAAGFTRQQAHSPQITHTEGECRHLLPPALGGTPIG